MKYMMIIWQVMLSAERKMKQRTGIFLFYIDQLGMSSWGVMLEQQPEEGGSEARGCGGRVF